jgi:uncharacterized protein (TIGR02452 family)
MNREKRVSIARETLKIAGDGCYNGPSGKSIDISADLQAAVANSHLYRPVDFPAETISTQAQGEWPDRVVEVTPETTLEAARRLAQADPREDLMCLNFASAKNPGGGFLSGSQAQEESLARSSGLYPCISQMSEMYDYNRRAGTCLYSDHMIYSPGVPVFRDDSGELLEPPYRVAIVTAPAVNAGAVEKNEPARVQMIRRTMEVRLARVLWVAEQNGCARLVLGAWGCGVFANDPSIVAGLFREVLGPGGPFSTCFRHVVYAVYDNSPDQRVIAAFREAFAHPNGQS